MLRGYRGIIVAFGLILSAAHPNPNDQSQQTEAKGQPGDRPSAITRPTSSPVQIVQATANPPPCGPGEYNSKDDLCAQWKAADSASDAAWWAMASTCIALLGTVAIFYQVKLTREAVQDTGKATQAMERQTALATEQQRPWLVMWPQVIQANYEQKCLVIRAKWVLKNVGATVARNIRFSDEIIRIEEDARVETIPIYNRIIMNLKPSYSNVIPGDDFDTPVKGMIFADSFLIPKARRPRENMRELF